MHTRSWKRILVLASFLFLWVPFMVTPVLADCSDNMLVNPGFENGYYRGEEVGTSLSSYIANGWMPWSLVEGIQENREPEYSIVNRRELSDGDYRVRSGDYAQKIFTDSATHTSGFYQRVRMTPGSRVNFSIWVQIATGEHNISSGGHPISDLKNPGRYRVFAGIDPYGGLPTAFGAPPPSSTIWSDPVVDYETRTIDEEGHKTDAWVQLSISAVAQGNYITVYTKGIQEFPVKNNDSFWDDACLIMDAQPTVTPPPPTPLPPTDTPVPTDTPTPSPSPTPAMGTISALVFEDLDGDGQRGGQEPPLSGAHLELLDEEGTVIESHITDDSDEPHTFTVAPGDYTVVEAPPEGYVSVSSDRWAGTVVAGGQVDVSFAAQPQPSATPTATTVSPTATGEPEEVTPTPTDVAPTPPPSDMDGGFWTSLYGVSGILVAVLALVVPLGLYLWHSHR